jgi:hypothetical protein
MQQLIAAAIAFTLLSSAALAQQAAPQGSDPAFLQTAIATLQAQRNRAYDEAAAAEARLANAQNEIIDLKGQIDALKSPAKCK